MGHDRDVKAEIMGQHTAQDGNVVGAILQVLQLFIVVDADEQGIAQPATPPGAGGWPAAAAQASGKRTTESRHGVSLSKTFPCGGGKLITRARKKVTETDSPPWVVAALQPTAGIGNPSGVNTREACLLPRSGCISQPWVRRNATTHGFSRRSRWSHSTHGL